jgi:hypothetical protein
MNDELERMLKEVVVPHWNFPGGTEENHEHSVRIDGVPTENRPNKGLDYKFCYVEKKHNIETVVLRFENWHFWV